MLHIAVWIGVFAPNHHESDAGSTLPARQRCLGLVQHSWYPCRHDLTTPIPAIISHYTVTSLGIFSSYHWIPHLQAFESHPEPPQGVHKNLAIDRHLSGDTLDTDTECCLDVPAYSEHNIEVSRDEPARQSRSAALVASSYEMILLLFVCHLPGQRW